MNGYASFPKSYYYLNGWGIKPNYTIAAIVEPNDKMFFLTRTAHPSIPANQAPLLAYRFNSDGSPDTAFKSLI